MKSAFFVQARMASTRLPGKVTKPVFEEVSILELVLKRLALCFPNAPVFILTTTTEADDRLVQAFENYPVTVFRGDENNVLGRFTAAARKFGVSDLIRVCGDNPFLLPEFLKELYDHPFQDLDYLSFSFEGKPAMKCHFGLFAERIRIAALEKAETLALETVYLEHVTNFIYEHPELFKLKWLDKSTILAPLRDFRLTVDTMEDFTTVKQLLLKLHNPFLPELNEILAFSQSAPELVASMKNQIKLNSK